MKNVLILCMFLFCFIIAQMSAQIISNKDCDKFCGSGNGCSRTENGSQVECTTCGKRRKLRNGKCLYLGQWSSWSHCTATCGLGKSTRKRECLGDRTHLCFPSAPQQRECRAGPCTPAVTGWSPWGQCSTSCGDGGAQSRHRHCLTDDTLPCTQDLVDSRTCADNPPCDCQWCEWREKKTGFTQDCLEVTREREREPNCPAYRPPGNHCYGPSIDLQTSPQAAGRRAEIEDSKTLKYNIIKMTAYTKFDFSCAGGCIKIEKVSFHCQGRYPGTKRIEEFCGGKDRCVFKPDGKFFGVDHLNCIDVKAWVELKCVGGTAVAKHIGLRQVEDSSSSEGSSSSDSANSS